MKVKFQIKVQNYFTLLTNLVFKNMFGPKLAKLCKTVLKNAKFTK